MKAHLCASRLLCLLPVGLFRNRQVTGSFTRTRRRVDCGPGRRELLFYRMYSPSQSNCNSMNLLAVGNPDTDTNINSYDSYLIPTLSATIKCGGNIADELVEAIMCFGASSVSVENGAPLKEGSSSGPIAWSNDKQQFWDECELVAFFPPGQDVQECLALAFDSIGLKEMLPYKLAEVQHQNWEQQVKDLFQPLEVSDGLWIIPQWCSLPDPSATNVILDPGLAFGTGDHPTTQLCLRWLKHVLKGGEHIMDYGSGSGILAIAALKLGAACAVGVDIDPMAVCSAKHNASLNDLGEDLLQLYVVSCGNEEPIVGADAEYDVVVANLLLNPLLLLSGRLLGYTKPGGLLGLSGILESQVDQVRQLYGSHLENIEVQTQDGWACLTGSRTETMHLSIRNNSTVAE